MRGTLYWLSALRCDAAAAPRVISSWRLRVSASSNAAREGAQPEGDRDRDHVNDYDLLEEQRIAALQRDVEKPDDHEARPQRDTEYRADRSQRERKTGRLANLQIAAGKRALAFLRMPAVRFAIADIVHHVAEAGDRAERDEGDDRAHEVMRAEKVLAEKEGGEDHQVLRPL